jgi:hypothetical protein
MIRMFAIMLALAWLLGIIAFNPLGGGIHLFLVGSMVLATMEIMRGRKTPVWLSLSPRRVNNIKSSVFYSKYRE